MGNPEVSRRTGEVLVGCPAGRKYQQLPALFLYFPLQQQVEARKFHLITLCEASLEPPASNTVQLQADFPKLHKKVHVVLQRPLQMDPFVLSPRSS